MPKRFKRLYLTLGSKKLSSVFIVFFGLIALLVGFQNCGKAGFDSSGQDPTQQSINPSSGAPFAFEATADMITYNSCSSPSSQGKTSNFMIGSYDTKVTIDGDLESYKTVAKSGVRIHPDFIDYAYEVLKPDYPNKEITLEQVKKLLAESELNSNVIPQFSVRSINKGIRLQNIYGKSNTPTYGIDVLPNLGNLANATWATGLLNQSFPRREQIDFLNFFPEASYDKSRLEAAFHFNVNAQTSEDYRNAFSKIGPLDAQIVLGFSYENEGVLISDEPPDSEVMSTAYARGYQMTFAIPTTNGTPSSWPYHPNNVVSSVQEMNLETNQRVNDAIWDCGVKLNIVRAEDAFFEWSALEAAVDIAVMADGTIPSDEAANPGFNKTTEKSRIKSLQAAYYGRTDGQTTAGFCPKMEYNELRQVPTSHPVYSVGVYAGKTYAEILEMVRRHLPASDWDINLNEGCVVPKKFSCYLDDALPLTQGGTFYGKYKVANAINKACVYPFDSSYSKAEKYGSEVDWCNEFVTICTKR